MLFFLIHTALTRTHSREQTTQTPSGTITLMNPARIHNLELIPVETGDYEAMRETVELSVALKRACCGTGTTSLEEQTALFWSNYDELVAHTPDTDIRDALRRLVATVQHHLLVFNYLAWATFTPGCPDMATLSAISVCLLCTIRSPFLSLFLSLMPHRTAERT